MIDYKKVARGDILKLVGEGAPGFAKNGELVRVLEQTAQGVMVEDKHGAPMEFVFNCGAARLEPTEWKNDFPEFPPVESEEIEKHSDLMMEFVGRASARFVMKIDEGFEGWDDLGKRVMMYNAADAKLTALGTGTSMEPEKDCADIINYALFLYNIQKNEDPADH